MVWLIQQLVYGLILGIRVVFIGPPSFRPMGRKPTADEVTIPTGSRPPFQQFTYGSVAIRAWRNWSKQGELYFNLDLVRLVGRGRVAKSFRPADLDDVERCVHKMRAWLRESN